MKRMMSFLTGAVMGGLVGATLAILLAPASGEDLRGELRERFDAFRNELQASMSESRVQLEHKLEEMRKPAPPAA